jgi:hypothetical protein
VDENAEGGEDPKTVSNISSQKSSKFFRASLTNCTICKAEKGLLGMIFYHYFKLHHLQCMKTIACLVDENPEGEGDPKESLTDPRKIHHCFLGLSIKKRIHIHKRIV